MKEELIKIKVGEKECFAKLIFCSKEDCKDFAETKLTQDDKFYCEKHGGEKVGNFMSAINSLGGFV